MDPVAPLRMSRVLPTPLPYAGSAIWGYVLVGLGMRDIASLSASVRESLVCLALLTREVEHPFIYEECRTKHSPPSFARFEQRMTVPNF